MGKTISLDENAYGILAEVKQRLRNQGISATFSDAIRELHRMAQKNSERMH